MLVSLGTALFRSEGFDAAVLAFGLGNTTSLTEADARPALLCPVCRAKLCWNLGLDPLARYRGLGEVWARAGVKDAVKSTAAAATATREHARD